ncbi:DUF3105 domain-containing protein [Deinococcus sp.]|uniref:DUF3105 domain-containing protein n=1 Tax=Deinococcus sp. TaxID=47478 RepID=UPI003CC52212
MKRLLCLVAAALSLAACSKDELASVKTYTYAGGIHQEGQIQYAEHPPVGGPHNPRWQQCGLYDKPLYDQYAVHSMEHGAVWVTYLPTLPAADLTALKAVLEGRSYVILSPYPGQASAVMASAWNAQLALETASNPRLKAFLAKYEEGASAPERGAACDGPYSTTATQ